MDNATLILMIEDNPRDYEIAMRAFKEVGLRNPVTRCKDGDEGLDYLFRKGSYTDPRKSPRPAMILLDLNLPGTDGREVLEEVKADETLKKIPIVVLTTSADPYDIERCYAMGANTYIKKPVTFEGFIEAVKELNNYWFKIAILPKDPNDS